MKIKEEKKPRFSYSKLSTFTQTQLEETIIDKIKKEGVFTEGEKEIKNVIN